LFSGGITAAFSYTYATAASNNKITMSIADVDNPDNNTETNEGTIISKPNIYEPNVPYPQWDYDWDLKHRPVEVHASTETSRHRCPTRHILLIRHGQYDQTSSDDKNRTLTELGQRQAKFTGQRLVSLMNVNPSISLDASATTSQYSEPCPIKTIHVSDMTRAKETANIILDELHHEGYEVVVSKPDPLLNEGLPATVIPFRSDLGTIDEQNKEIEENNHRIEEAFQKYFYRSSSIQPESPAGTGSESLSDHEFEVIVCHGNVIRYFIMRALQLPPEAWLRLSLFNCSISYLIIQPNGYVSARTIGDTGHIPYHETTFSGRYGYKWAGSVQ
jgi:serine/threonine-protein phosphatase PGAM5